MCLNHFVNIFLTDTLESCCSDHEMVDFRILHGGSRSISIIKTLDFRRANFGLFKELLGGIPWARALEGRGVQ